MVAGGRFEGFCLHVIAHVAFFAGNVCQGFLQRVNASNSSEFQLPSQPPGRPF